MRHDTCIAEIEKIEKRHLYFGDKQTKMALKVQSDACFYLSKFLRKKGFVEIRPPIISSCTDTGIRGAGTAIIDFYGRPYKVTTSMILHKQLAITAFEKIFAFSPNVRLEPLESIGTKRHLAEFTQLDLEAAYQDRDYVMGLAEEMLCYCIKKVRKSCEEELLTLERNLKKPKKPFKRISYAKALDLLSSEGFGVTYGLEIPWNGEKFLSGLIGDFFWIIDYPVGSRGFYEKQNRDSLIDFDLIYPEGYGEAISGSEREHDVGKVIQKMQQASLKLDDFKWYVELLEKGVPPSAGFGLGIERFTRYLCGLEAVWQAAAFPKVPGIYSP
ncbi:MAG: asparagine synthetase A [Candidatus Diapherotrites archaeon]|nr:asparagine synthetase A [Candidatus Diapherotrites archaeon]